MATLKAINVNFGAYVEPFTVQVRRAGESIEDFRGRVEKAAEASQKAFEQRTIATALRDAISPADKLKAKLDALKKGLDDGRLSAEQYAAAYGQVMGQWRQATAAARAPVENLIKSARAQADTVGMTARQLALYEARQRGATEWDLYRIDAALRQKEVIGAAYASQSAATGRMAAKLDELRGASGRTGGAIDRLLGPKSALAQGMKMLVGGGALLGIGLAARAVGQLGDAMQAAARKAGELGSNMYDVQGALFENLPVLGDVYNGLKSLFTLDQTMALAQADARTEQLSKRLALQEDEKKRLAEVAAAAAAARRPIDELVNSLERQVAVLGMTEDEVKFNEAAWAGATQADLDRIDALQQQIRAEEARQQAMRDSAEAAAEAARRIEDENRRIEQSISSWLERLKTPTEVYAERLREIEEWLRKGAISAAQYAKFKADLDAQLAKDTERKEEVAKDRSGGRMTVGYGDSSLTAGYSAALREQTTNVDWDKLSVEEARKQTTLLQKVAAALATLGTGEGQPLLE